MLHRNFQFFASRQPRYLLGFGAL